MKKYEAYPRTCKINEHAKFCKVFALFEWLLPSKRTLHVSPLAWPLLSPFSRPMKMTTTKADHKRWRLQSMLVEEGPFKVDTKFD